LRPLTRGGEAAIHQKFVESSLQSEKRFFLPRKCQHPLQCKVLKHLSQNHLGRYFAPFPQHFPRMC
jgi:hypothetical protein